MKKKTSIKIKSVLLLVIFAVNLSFEISMNSNIFSNSVNENPQVDQVNEISERDIESEEISLFPKESGNPSDSWLQIPLSSLGEPLMNYYDFTASGKAIIGCEISTSIPSGENPILSIDNGIGQFECVYGKNSFPVDFGSDSLTFLMDIENSEYIDTLYIQPLVIVDYQFEMAQDEPEVIKFPAGGIINILIKPTFSFDDFSLNLDGLLLKPVEDLGFEDGVSYYYEYQMEVPAKVQHALIVGGVGGVDLKIVSDIDYDDDGLLTSEEIQDGTDPASPDTWGYFDHGSDLGSDYDDTFCSFNLFLPQDATILMKSDSGILSDIRIDAIQFEGLIENGIAYYTDLGLLNAGQRNIEYALSGTIPRITFYEQIGSVLKKIRIKQISSEFDQDSDFLTDAYELQIGTNHFNPDTDGDGAVDGIDLSPFDSSTLEVGDLFICALPVDPTQTAQVKFSIAVPKNDSSQSGTGVLGSNSMIFPMVRIYKNNQGKSLASDSLCLIGNDLNHIELTLPEDLPTVVAAIEEYEYVPLTITESTWETSVIYTENHDALLDNILVLKFDLVYIYANEIDGEMSITNIYPMNEAITIQGVSFMEIESFDSQIIRTSSIAEAIYLKETFFDTDLGLTPSLGDANLPLTVNINRNNIPFTNIMDEINSYHAIWDNPNEGEFDVYCFHGSTLSIDLIRNQFEYLPVEIETPYTNNVQVNNFWNLRSFYNEINTVSSNLEDVDMLHIIQGDLCGTFSSTSNNPSANVVSETSLISIDLISNTDLGTGMISQSLQIKSQEHFEYGNLHEESDNRNKIRNIDIKLQTDSVKYWISDFVYDTSLISDDILGNQMHSNIIPLKNQFIQSKDDLKENLKFFNYIDTFLSEGTIGTEGISLAQLSEVIDVSGMSGDYSGSINYRKTKQEFFDQFDDPIEAQSIIDDLFSDELPDWNSEDLEEDNIFFDKFMVFIESSIVVPTGIYTDIYQEFCSPTPRTGVSEGFKESIANNQKINHEIGKKGIINTKGKLNNGEVDPPKLKLFESKVWKSLEIVSFGLDLIPSILMVIDGIKRLHAAANSDEERRTAEWNMAFLVGIGALITGVVEGANVVAEFTEFCYKLKTPSGETPQTPKKLENVLKVFAVAMFIVSVFCLGVDLYNNIQDYEGDHLASQIFCSILGFTSAAVSLAATLITTGTAGAILGPLAIVLVVLGIISFFLNKLQKPHFTTNDISFNFPNTTTNEFDDIECLVPFENDGNTIGDKSEVKLTVTFAIGNDPGVYPITDTQSSAKIQEGKGATVVCTNDLPTTNGTLFYYISLFYEIWYRTFVLCFPVWNKYLPVPMEVPIEDSMPLFVSPEDISQINIVDNEPILELGLNPNNYKKEGCIDWGSTFSPQVDDWVNSGAFETVRSLDDHDNIIHIKSTATWARAYYSFSSSRTSGFDGLWFQLPNDGGKWYIYIMDDTTNILFRYCFVYGNIYPNDYVVGNEIQSFVYDEWMNIHFEWEKGGAVNFYLDGNIIHSMACGNFNGERFAFSSQYSDDSCYVDAIGLSNEGYLRFSNQKAESILENYHVDYTVPWGSAESPLTTDWGKSGVNLEVKNVENHEDALTISSTAIWAQAYYPFGMSRTSGFDGLWFRLPKDGGKWYIYIMDGTSNILFRYCFVYGNIYPDDYVVGNNIHSFTYDEWMNIHFEWEKGGTVNFYLDGNIIDSMGCGNFNGERLAFSSQYARDECYVDSIGLENEGYIKFTNLQPDTELDDYKVDGTIDWGSYENPLTANWGKSGTSLEVKNIFGHKDALAISSTSLWAQAYYPFTSSRTSGFDGLWFRLPEYGSKWYVYIMDGTSNILFRYCFVYGNIYRDDYASENYLQGDYNFDNWMNIHFEWEKGGIVKFYLDGNIIDSMACEDYYGERLAFSSQHADDECYVDAIGLNSEGYVRYSNFDPISPALNYNLLESINWGSVENPDTEDWVNSRAILKVQDLFGHRNAMSIRSDTLWDRSYYTFSESRSSGFDGLWFRPSMDGGKWYIDYEDTSGDPHYPVLFRICFYAGNIYYWDYPTSINVPPSKIIGTFNYGEWINVHFDWQTGDEVENDSDRKVDIYINEELIHTENLANFDVERIAFHSQHINDEAYVDAIGLSSLGYIPFSNLEVRAVKEISTVATSTGIQITNLGEMTEHLVVVLDGLELDQYPGPEMWVSEPICIGSGETVSIDLFSPDHFSIAPGSYDSVLIIDYLAALQESVVIRGTVNLLTSISVESMEKPILEPATSLSITIRDNQDIIMEFRVINLGNVQDTISISLDILTISHFDVVQSQSNFLLDPGQEEVLYITISPLDLGTGLFSLTATSSSTLTECHLTVQVLVTKPFSYKVHGTVDWGTPLEEDFSSFGLVGNIEVIESYGGHRDIIEITDSDDTIHSLTYNYPTGRAQDAFELYLASDKPDSTYPTYHIILNNDTTQGGVIRISNSDLQYWDGSTYVNLGTLNFNQFYHYRIEYDCTVGSFDLYIDGILIGDDLPLYAPIESVTKIRVSTYASRSGYHVYMDALGIQSEGYIPHSNLLPIQPKYDYKNAGTIDWGEANQEDLTPFGIGGTVKVIESYGGHRDVIEITDSNDTTQSVKYNYLTSQTQDAFELYLASDKSSFTGVTYHITLHNDTTQGGIIRITNSVLQYWNGSVYKNLGTLNFYQFYHYRIEYDCNIGSFDLYVNGILVGNDLPLYSPIESVSTIKISTYGSRYDYHVYMDTLGIESQGYVTYSNSFLLSTSVPTGTIQINDGEGYSSTENLELTLYSLSAIEMQFSLDYIDWTDWESFESFRTMTVPTLEESVTIWVKYRDVHGFVSLGFISETVIWDFVDPMGTILINDGETYCTLAEAHLTVSGTDTSPLTGMRFSFDEISWTDWEPYATSKILPIIAEDGEISIYFQVKDSAGSISPTQSDTIILDTTVPTGTVIINDGNSTMANLTADIQISAFDENGVVEMRLSFDGTTWNEWESLVDSKSITFPDGEGTKTIYLQFKDEAGLISTEVISDSIEYSISTEPIPTETKPKVHGYYGIGVIGFLSIIGVIWKQKKKK